MRIAEFSELEVPWVRPARHARRFFLGESAGFSMN